MKLNWPEVTIEEITSKLGDGLHGTPAYSEEGEYFFVNGNNLNNGHIIFDEKTKLCTTEEFEKYKKPLNDRTILVSINGTLGNVAYYKGEKIILGKSACYLNLKKEIDKRFVGFIISSPKFQKYLERIATGTTIKNVSLKSMREFSFQLPSSFEQKAISSVLGALDDKIDNNRRMNETLEEMARAIFKSWFVDFDPVHAKAAGNAPAHMNAETATLFPSSFGDNGLPAGWKASKFEDLIEFKNGYAFKSKEISKDFKTNFAIFKMGHIKVGGGFNDSCKTDYLISDASQKMKKYILETGDVLMSMTDMKDNVRLLGHTALFYEQNVNFLVNQRVGLIKAKKEITNYPYIYCLTNNKTFLNEIRKRANSGVQVNLSTDGIKTTPTIMPPLSLMAKFGSLSYPIFERIFSSLKENQSLAELRDFLLPKLMSGEIRVKDAEREVEAAV